MDYFPGENLPSEPPVSRSGKAAIESPNISRKGAKAAKIGD